MTTPILAAKITPPPVHPGWIPRPRLIAHLSAGLWNSEAFTRKLTVISAAAGSGKTTLAGQWLRSLDMRFAWLTLDERDNDPARFLLYLAAAAQTVHPAVGAALSGRLAAASPPPAETALASLAGEISAARAPFILVLDDYHILHSPAVHQMLNFLLEYQPANLHLLVCSREDPPVPMARLRARLQLVELRQVDLNFTPAEAGELLYSAASMQLAQAELLPLMQKTEGWAAGLQLAALSLRSAADPHVFFQSLFKSPRYILDYLMDEVLAQQSPTMQRFLLHTSVLERLCAGLCEAVTGDPGSAACLERLESTNLFVSALDPQREWYRYHPLFADLLRHRLRISAGADTAALHSRAAGWFESHGFPQEAVEHYLQAGSWAQAVQLIEGQIDDLLRRGHFATLLDWCQKLPEAEIHARPRLCLSLAWPMVLTGQVDAAESLLEVVQVGIAGISGPEVDLLQGGIHALRANIARSRGDDAALLMYSQQALELLPPSDLSTRELLALNLGLVYWHRGQLEQAEAALAETLHYTSQTGNRYAGLTAQIFTARILVARGHFQQALAVFQALSKAAEGTPAAALVDLDLGGIYYEWNQLDLCQLTWEHSLEAARLARSGEFQISAHCQLARLNMAKGSPGAAALELRSADALLSETSVVPLTRRRLAAAHLLLALHTGDLRAAETWLSQAESGDPHPAYPFLGLSQARLLMAQGQAAAADAELGRCFNQAEESGWLVGAAAVLAMQAANQPQDDLAESRLRQALVLADPNGLKRTFLDRGDALLPVLRRITGGQGAALASELLSLLGDRSVPVTPASQPGSELIEPLSQREFEVLALLAAGLSNQDIADRLVISLGTVKTHVHNILAKLEVDSRTQALHRARALGLIKT